MKKMLLYLVLIAILLVSCGSSGVGNLKPLSESAVLVGKTDHTSVYRVVDKTEYGDTYCYFTEDTESGGLAVARSGMTLWCND